MVRHTVFYFYDTCAVPASQPRATICYYLTFYSRGGSVWVHRQQVVNREAADNGYFLSVVYLILCDLG
jgi:hypothetical protein